MTVNTPLTRLQQLLPQLFQPVTVTGDPYLRLQLTDQLPVLLSMERVQEAILVPASAISPLPNVPAFTIGMLSARDRVFWVVDLAQFLGVAPPLPLQQNYQVIVMNLVDANLTGNAASKLVGLAVKQIQGMVRLAGVSWQPIDESVPKHLAPYLQGYLVSEQKQVLVMDAAAILTSPDLSFNPVLQFKPAAK